MPSLFKVVAPITSILALIIAIYGWMLEDARKVRIDEAIELLKELNNTHSGNTTNFDSIRNEVIQLQFDKQSYTAHIDLMSNWFILFETILFGIFFVVGYGIFDNKIADSKKDNEAAYKRIDERYIQFENEFNDMKGLLYSGFTSIHYLICETNKSIPALVLLHSIRGAKAEKDSFDIKPDPNKLSNIKFGLDKAIEILSNSILMEITLKFPNIKYELINARDSLNRISNINDSEVKIKCAIALVKISEKLV